MDRVLIDHWSVHHSRHLESLRAQMESSYWLDDGDQLSGSF